MWKCSFHTIATVEQKEQMTSYLSAQQLPQQIWWTSTNMWLCITPTVETAFVYCSWNIWTGHSHKNVLWALEQLSNSALEYKSVFGGGEIPLVFGRTWPTCLRSKTKHTCPWVWLISSCLWGNMRPSYPWVSEVPSEATYSNRKLIFAVVIIVCNVLPWQLHGTTWWVDKGT